MTTFVLSVLGVASLGSFVVWFVSDIVRQISRYRAGWRGDRFSHGGNRYTPPYNVKTGEGLAELRARQRLSAERRRRAGRRP